MKEQKKFKELNNCKYRTISCGAARRCIIYITGTFMNVNLSNYYDRISANTGMDDFLLCEVLVEEWDKYLTPWKINESIIDGRQFEGKADCLLENINNNIIPEICDSNEECKEYYVAGYSLAGLFAMWAYYQSEKVTGAVSCSGSLWYPGWREYIADKQECDTGNQEYHKGEQECDTDMKKYVIDKQECPTDKQECSPDMKEHVTDRKHNGRVYLSLGDKEYKTKNPVMSRVLEITKYQNELLKNSFFELNPGGHFNNVDERVIKGMSWIINKSKISPEL